jgi:hypothetical protein
MRIARSIRDSRPLRWGVAPVGILLLVFVPLWFAIRPTMVPDRIAFVNLVVVAATGLVVAWYTWETRQLRKATLDQTNLQIRPFLSLEYDQAGRALRLHNIGRGVARDVHIHDVRLSKTARLGEPTITVEWDAIDFIPSGEHREVVPHGQVITPEDKWEISKDRRTYMSNFGKHGKADYEFVIDYADLNGTYYRAVFEVVLGKTFLLRDALR